MHARLLHEESSSNPRISMARMSPDAPCRGDRQYSLPALVRRPITDERRACQADPAGFGLFQGGAAAAQMLAAVRACSASCFSTSRNAAGVAIRRGKSSLSVMLSACMSMPSGSQPVQRQSAALGAEQPGRVEGHGIAMIGVHVVDRALLGLQQRPGIGNVGQELRRARGRRSGRNPATRWMAAGRIRKNEKSLKSTKASAEGWALR